MSETKKMMAIKWAVEDVDNPDRQRAIGLLEDGTMALARMEKGRPLVAELLFDAKTAVNIAAEILSNNARAITEPGALRMLAAALILNGLPENDTGDGPGDGEGTSAEAGECAQK